MRARGLRHSCAGLAVALLGCRHTPSSAADERIASDLHTLCVRAADRSIDGWSQPVMMTDEMQSLTVRVDQGDASARCELGRLMRKHQRTTCKQSIPALLSSCGDG